MTASTAKSTALTNLVAAPPVVRAAGVLGGRLKVAVDTAEVATTSIDETNDKVQFAILLPSNAYLHSLRIYNDDLDSNVSPALAVDVGLANGPKAFVDGSTTYAAFAAISASAIASAITTLQAANTVGVEIGFEARDIDKVNTPLWSLLGLSKDPHAHLLVEMTVTTAAGTAAAGTVTLVALYAE